MLILLFIAYFLPNAGGVDDARYMHYDGARVKTTYHVPDKFLGEYKGSKPGRLLLAADGTGVYEYGYVGFAGDSCQAKEIPMIWGFIIDDDGAIVSFEREYGHSYPLVYNSTSEVSFQGCTKNAMIDYLLVFKDGTISVSSSDNWKKVQ